MLSICKKRQFHLAVSPRNGTFTRLPGVQVNTAPAAPALCYSCSVVCCQLLEPNFQSIVSQLRQSLKNQVQKMLCKGCNSQRILSKNCEIYSKLVHNLLKTYQSILGDLGKHQILVHLLLQAVSIACYAETGINCDRNVCPSICYMLALCQNDASQDHKIFTDEDSSIRNKKLIQKFQMIHPDTGVGGKTVNFQPISCRISETVQDRTEVTIND